VTPYPKSGQYEWNIEMKTELKTHDITAIIAQANRDRSDALGTLIAAGSRKALSWTARHADRFLHAFLMSPVNPR
jgi:hypothetical protein